MVAPDGKTYVTSWAAGSYTVTTIGIANDAGQPPHVDPVNPYTTDPAQAGDPENTLVMELRTGKVLIENLRRVTDRLVASEEDYAETLATGFGIRLTQVGELWSRVGRRHEELFGA